jgi:hypothetical protein
VQFRKTISARMAENGIGSIAARPGASAGFNERAMRG